MCIVLADFSQQDGSAAQHVWQSLWAHIKLADVFISHPVKSFVPSVVNMKTVGWLPATTDWYVCRTLDSIQNRVCRANTGPG